MELNFLDDELQSNKFQSYCKNSEMTEDIIRNARNSNQMLMDLKILDTDDRDISQLCVTQKSMNNPNFDFKNGPGISDDIEFAAFFKDFDAKSIPAKESFLDNSTIISSYKNDKILYNLKYSTLEQKKTILVKQE